MVTRIIGVGLMAALDAGEIDAARHLAKQLAQQIEGEADAGQRRELVKAFLEVLRQIKAWDLAERREQRLAARQILAVTHPKTPGLVDDLRTRREAKMRRQESRSKRDA